MSKIGVSWTDRIGYGVSVRVHQALKCSRHLYRLVVLSNRFITSPLDLDGPPGVSSARALLCMCNSSAKTSKLMVLRLNFNPESSDGSCLLGGLRVITALSPVLGQHSELRHHRFEEIKMTRWRDPRRRSITYASGIH